MAKRDNWLTAVWTKYLLLKYIILAKAAEDSFEIRKNQLQLALTWNRADIAQEEIFREDVLWPPSMEYLDNFFLNLIFAQCTYRYFIPPDWTQSLCGLGSLDDILMEAIIEEKVEFVALILQQNVGMKEFLSKERLQQLYQKVSYRSHK